MSEFVIIQNRLNMVKNEIEKKFWTYIELNKTRL
jgi:hypothetical protein